MGTQLPSPERGTAASCFRPLSIVAKRLDGSRWHLVLEASAQATLYRTNPIRHHQIFMPFFTGVISTSFYILSYLSKKYSRSYIKVSISHLASSVLPRPLLHTTYTHLLPSKVIISEAMMGNSTSVLVSCSCFGFQPSPIPPKRGIAAPYFSALVCCGQMVAHLSYC